MKEHILDRRGGHVVTWLLQSVLASVARSDRCLCTRCVYILFINHPVCYVQWGHLNSQDSFSLSYCATRWIHLLRMSIVQRWGKCPTDTSTWALIDCSSFVSSRQICYISHWKHNLFLKCSVFCEGGKFGKTQMVCRSAWKKLNSNYLIYLFIYLFILFFWPCHTACGILVPRPGIEPRPSAVKVWSPNHWTAREFPQLSLLDRRVLSNRPQSQPLH